jgi:hypothetical protein
MSSLKFKSIIVDKKNKNYGDPIEYTPEEKIPVALQMAVAESPIYKDKFLVAVTGVTVTSYTFAPLGEKLNKKFANNVYEAFGTAQLNKRNVHTNSMARPENKSYTLKFEDCLDPNGLPEFRIVSLRME